MSTRVLIATLYACCSYVTADAATLRRGGLAASDTCQRPASSGVRNPNDPDAISLRCATHEGLWRDETPAEVVLSVERLHELS